jgi:3-deoxy-D-manno-octulosonic-acid transferase
MAVLFDIAYCLAAAAISPVAIYRMLRHKRYRAGWKNRFGHISRKQPGKKCIWIHAVSVGEVNATTMLIKELEKKFPDYEIVVSTTTDTGFARANELFGSRLSVFYFPMDFSRTMRRAFENILPAIILLMELEVWPNLVRIAHQSGVPVVVVNGRISNRGFARYKSVKPLVKKTFQNVTLVLAQTDDYADKFRRLGAPAEKVIVTGSLKYDTAQIADSVDGADILAEQLFGKISNQQSAISNRLWVAGATGDGEESIILDVYRRLVEQKQFADLRLAIVPRKPERFNEVADLIKEKGFDLIRYSKVKSADQKLKIENRKLKIVLGDTMGDLRKFYSLATVIFVGRSLVPMGGSDMMESAALGKCTIFGPHTFNFKQTVEDLLKNDGAIEVQNGQELFEVMQKCLENPNYASEIAHSGQKSIRKNQGATARTVSQITKLLNPSQFHG